MNINRKTSVIKENNQGSKKKITTSSLTRLAGLSAMVGGIFYVVVGMFHQPNIVSSATTIPWAIVHALATAMCFLFLLGIAGLYARQVEEAGWLGLAGFLLHILGGLLFGIATFRAGILPRWAAGLLAVGSMLSFVGALLQPEHEPKVAVPVAVALAWLGYALWSERRTQTPDSAITIARATGSKAGILK